MSDVETLVREAAYKIGYAEGKREAEAKLAKVRELALQMQRDMYGIPGEYAQEFLDAVGGAPGD